MKSSTASNTPGRPAPPPFRETLPGGVLRMNWHEGQQRAWDTRKRITAIIAGHQSGKTEFGPHWLFREIQECGPGDYLGVSPTFQLLIKKALPAFLQLFRGSLRLGSYKSQEKTFEFSPAGFARAFGKSTPYEPTKVFFGHASDPDSLESATGKAAWLDEAGQNRFKLDSFEAIQRRLNIHQGRILIGTTPYNLGWLKQQIHDPWLRSGKNHPQIEVVNFDSIANPAFPRAEYEAKRLSLPAWKFNLFYKGIFERPAGAIFDRFNDCPPPAGHVVPRFAVPPHWPRYVGMDFGATNTAAVFVAAELDPSTRVRTGTYYAYREYRPGKVPPQTHVVEMLKGEPSRPTAVGGNPQEDEWRRRFSQAGLGILEPPVKDVEVGIDALYEMTVNQVNGKPELLFMDDLRGVLDQMASYSRVVDELGEATEEIEDKSLFHYVDALRYLAVWLKRGGLQNYGPAKAPGRSALDSLPPGVFGGGAGAETGDEIPDPRGTVSSGRWEGAGMTFPQF